MDTPKNKIIHQHRFIIIIMATKDLANGPVGDVLAALGIPRERSNLFAGIVRRANSPNTKTMIRGAFLCGMLDPNVRLHLFVQAAGAATDAVETEGGRRDVAARVVARVAATAEGVLPADLEKIDRIGSAR